LRKEISPGTLKTLWTPIRTFCDAYDDLPPINWKRTSKSMPRFKPYSSDRIPTLEEIRKLCEYPDRRIKAIIYTMASSGIRIGAWDYPKWRHVTPIKDEKTGGEVIAAKLLAYAGEPEIISHESTLFVNGVELQQAEHPQPEYQQRAP
jgi:integrase